MNLIRSLSRRVGDTDHRPRGARIERTESLPLGRARESSATPEPAPRQRTPSAATIRQLPSDARRNSDVVESLHSRRTGRSITPIARKPRKSRTAPPEDEPLSPDLALSNQSWSQSTPHDVVWTRQGRTLKPGVEDKDLDTSPQGSVVAAPPAPARSNHYASTSVQGQPSPESSKRAARKSGFNAGRPETISEQIEDPAEAARQRDEMWAREERERRAALNAQAAAETANASPPKPKLLSKLASAPIKMGISPQKNKPPAPAINGARISSLPDAPPRRASEPRVQSVQTTLAPPETDSKRRSQSSQSTNSSRLSRGSIDAAADSPRRPQVDVTPSTTPLRNERVRRSIYGTPKSVPPEYIESDEDSDEEFYSQSESSQSEISSESELTQESESDSASDSDSFREFDDADVSAFEESQAETAKKQAVPAAGAATATAAAAAGAVAANASSGKQGSLDEERFQEEMRRERARLALIEQQREMAERKRMVIRQERERQKREQELLEQQRIAEQERLAREEAEKKAREEQERQQKQMELARQKESEMARKRALAAEREAKEALEREAAAAAAATEREVRLAFERAESEARAALEREATVRRQREQALLKEAKEKETRERDAHERGSLEIARRAKLEKDEAERIAHKKHAAAERIARQKQLEAERAAHEEQLAVERALREEHEANERAAREMQRIAERAAREKLEAERIAHEEKLAAEAAARAALEAAERVAREQQEAAERVAREQKEAAERAARELREAAERAAREQTEAAERAAREQREAAERAERVRREAAERAQREKEMAERLEAERIAREKEAALREEEARRLEAEAIANERIRIAQQHQQLEERAMKRARREVDDEDYLVRVAARRAESAETEDNEDASTAASDDHQSTAHSETTSVFSRFSLSNIQIVSNNAESENVRGILSHSPNKKTSGTLRFAEDKTPKPADEMVERHEALTSLNYVLENGAPRGPRILERMITTILIAPEPGAGVMITPNGPYREDAVRYCNGFTVHGLADHEHVSAPAGVRLWESAGVALSQWLVGSIDMVDIRALMQTSRAVREAVLNDEVREAAARRFLSQCGYTTWEGVDPLPITLLDLEAFVVYNSCSAEFRAAAHVYITRGHRLDRRIPRIVRASTRAYSKILARLRIGGCVPQQQMWVPGGAIESPYSPDRAALFYVWTPEDENSSWTSSTGLQRAERELFLSGVWRFLRTGDVVYNVSKADNYNDGRFIFCNEELAPLPTKYDRVGHLPEMIDMLQLPPTYYSRALRDSGAGPVVFLDILPYRSEILSSLYLSRENVETTSVNRRYRINKWVYRATVDIFAASDGTDANGTHPGWNGTLAIILEGTAEHARELVRRCVSPVEDQRLFMSLAETIVNGHDLPHNLPHPEFPEDDAGHRIPHTFPWQILRERSQPGLIWISML
ncbi:hypothetical protein MCUN1_001603 [Malassezia cuniculi]|uniref:Uncharacterized protein n=1 Tax=Malassezia cuniculi TaxID=948313 RepID=A0AAF0EUE5_9BASI|nr:hypothetical protein MCUN1_001603 [Malassezia cuniculi]